MRRIQWHSGQIPSNGVELANSGNRWQPLSPSPARFPRPRPVWLCPIKPLWPAIGDEWGMVLRGLAVFISLPDITQLAGGTVGLMVWLIFRAIPHVNGFIDMQRSRVQALTMTNVPTLESGRFLLPADKLQEGLKWMETSEEVPPIVKITTAAVIWFLQVDSFRCQEADSMLTGAYENSLSEHRYVLSQITTNGEKIYLAAKQNEISVFLNNFTIEDIRATLDSLRTTFICQHGEKNTPQINAAIEGLFNATQPAN